MAGAGRALPGLLCWDGAQRWAAHSSPTVLTVTCWHLVRCECARWLGVSEASWTPRARPPAALGCPECAAWESARGLRAPHRLRNRGLGSHELAEATSPTLILQLGLAALRILAQLSLGRGLTAAARRAGHAGRMEGQLCYPWPRPSPSPPYRALGSILVTSTLSRLMPLAQAFCWSRVGSRSEDKSSLGHQSGDSCHRRDMGRTWHQIPAVRTGCHQPLPCRGACWSGWGTVWWRQPAELLASPPAPRLCWDRPQDQRHPGPSPAPLRPLTLSTSCWGHPTGFVQRLQNNFRVQFCTREQTSPHALPKPAALSRGRAGVLGMSRHLLQDRVSSRVGEVVCWWAGWWRDHESRLCLSSCPLLWVARPAFLSFCVPSCRGHDAFIDLYAVLGANPRSHMCQASLCH